MIWSQFPPTKRGWYFCQCRPMNARDRGVCLLYVSRSLLLPGERVNMASGLVGALTQGCEIGASWLKDALWSDEPVPEPGVPVDVPAVPTVLTPLPLLPGDLAIIREALQVRTRLPSANGPQLAALIERLREQV